MASLDLRHVARVTILILAEKSWNFEIEGPIGSPSFIGATVTMTITRGSMIQILSVGSGITIISAGKIAIVALPLPEGNYTYIFEIIPVTGEVIRLIDEIQASNE